MLKKHLIACAAATALVGAPAYAQTAATPEADRPAATGAGTAGSPAMQPGGTGTAGTTAGGATGNSSTMQPGTSGMTGATTSTASGMAAGQQAAGMAPLAGPGQGHMMGSDIRGTRVYGANSENIGSINDIVVDRNGQLVALVVGVGGFLGIGQKDVAIPFGAVEIVSDRAQAGAAGTGANGPATTGSVGTTGAGAGAAAGGTVNPDRIVLRQMTKADLESAPEFRSDGRGTTGQTGTTGTGAAGTGMGMGAAGTGGTAAPRQ
jgi:sporulation protein YlmC with PRC-barrel domain